MKTLKRPESGVAHVLMLLLIVCVVAGVAVVGIRVVNRSNTVAPASSTVKTVTTVPSQIKTQSDIQQAQKALDSASLPDPNQLNSDITGLL
jgi:conjugal transfer/entry exclusion protein